MIVEIYILKKELYHDIDDDTHQMQKMRQLQEQDVSTDERYRYSINRHIERYFNEVVARCTAYLLLPDPSAQSIVNNHTKDWDERIIRMDLPKDWPVHTVGQLRDAAHQRIVKGVEFELFSQMLGSNDPYTQQCLAQSDDADRIICANINERMHPLRVPYTPFG